MHIRRWLLFGAALVASGLTSCAGGCECPAGVTDPTGCFVAGNQSPPPAAPAIQVRVWSGDAQVGPADALLDAPIEVRFERNGAPAGATVTFKILSGGGRVQNLSHSQGGDSVRTSTDANGVASVEWVLGSALGRQEVRVTFAGVPNFLDMTANAHGPPGLFDPIRGGGENAPAGGTTPTRPAVRLTDTQGNRIPGYRVLFQTPGLPGIDVATTGRTGEAELPVDWRMGNTPGQYVLTATVVAPGASATPLAINGNPVTFRANATAAAASSLAKAAGDGQTVDPGLAVPVRPAVVIRDQFGNPVPNVGVVFARLSAAGSLVDSMLTTDAAGRAEVTTWVPGPTGTHQLTATAAPPNITGSPATFTATVRSAPLVPPYRMLADSAWINGRSVLAGAQVAPLPAVRVIDQNGAPVPGQLITYSIARSSGFPTHNSFLSGVTPTTDANGVARLGGWRASFLATPNAEVVATAPSGGPFSVQSITFGIAIVAGPVTQLIKAVIDPPNVPAGAVVAPIPAVRVADQFGNGVGGGTVSFVAVTPGSSVSPANVTVDGMGAGRVTSWITSSTPGVNTLTVTLAGTQISTTFTVRGWGAAAALGRPGWSDPQNGSAGQPAPRLPAVQVLDAAGTPIPGVPVTFSVIQGGGSITPTNAIVTDVNGTAALLSWTLGTGAGVTNVVRATAGSLTIDFVVGT